MKSWIKTKTRNVVILLRMYINKQTWLIKFFAIIGGLAVLYLSVLVITDPVQAYLENKYKKVIIIENDNTKTNNQGTRGIDDQTDEASTEDEPIMEGTFSAYTSDPSETDGSPYVTADGTDLRTIYRCVVANNKLPFGTVVLVEGVGACEVHDRMNSRYDGSYFDIYFGNDKQRALEFGRKQLHYIIDGE
jgi:3D (Asp-Asp-Asp) domain-containing protein